jgi:hypothetical protein
VARPKSSTRTAFEVQTDRILSQGICCLAGLGSRASSGGLPAVLAGSATQESRFKQVHSSEPIYSVRISLNYRAVGVIEGDVIIWYWIGSHADYEKQLTKR